jgi:hypothetical protein
MYKPVDPLARKVRDLMDDSVERAMYDDVFGSASNRNKRTPSPYTSITTAAATNSSKIRQAGNDIISNGTGTDNAILKRLEQLEQESKQLRSQVANLTMTNESLKKENSILSNKVEALSECTYATTIDDLRKENTKLKSDLDEVHKFLSDYGLVWVGSKNDDELPDTSDAKDDENNDDKGYTVADSKHLYDEIFKSVNKLNAQTKAEPAVIHTSSDGRKARLVHGSEKMDTLVITFYLDGVLVNRGPFRNSESDSYHNFIQDILDGYFPAEYKDIYPDGFLLELVDRHDQNYSVEVSNATADSKGYTIGSNGNNNFTHNEAKAMSLEAFCNRLPKNVINNGNIISVKEDIKSRLQGGNSNSNNHSRSNSNNSNTSTILKSSTVLGLESSQEGATVGIAADDKTKLSTVQVRFAIIEKSESISNNSSNANAADTKSSANVDKKSVSHNVVLQVQMHANDTMKDVSELLLEYYLSNYSKFRVDTTITYRNVELRNPYPSRILSYEDTVQSAGYVPNGVMHARLTIP